jgi:putative tricarboxylic transport membrane protein
LGLEEDGIAEDKYLDLHDKNGYRSTSQGFVKQNSCFRSKLRGMSAMEITMTKDRAASLLFLLTGIYGLFFSIQLPMGKWNEPGPGVFPITLSILLLISGVAWFILGKRGAREKSQEKKAGWHDIVKTLSTPLKIVGITALLILTFNHVGYLAASSLYIFVLLFWVSRYRVIVSILLAVSIGIGSWYFFEKVLSVQLPKGSLFL